MLTSAKPATLLPPLLLLLLPLLLLPLTTKAIPLTTTPPRTVKMFRGMGGIPTPCPPEETDWCKEKLRNPNYCCNTTDPCLGFVLSSYCPITCGLCPEVCGGRKCRNSGNMDYTTCTCQCQGSTGGPLCEDCVGDDEDWCTEYKASSTCGQDYGIDPLACPYFCGLCPGKCRGKQCKNYGTLKVSNCTCACKGKFSGPNCEICPEADEPICVPQLKSYCNKEPNMKYIFRIKCPHLCGICP